MTTTSASVIYPELHDALTPGDLQELFNPSFDERKLAPSVARTPEPQVALLVHLKIFQTIGRFLPAADVPVDQTQALHALKSQGINVRAADLAFLSPYATSKLKRFGDYPTDLKVTLRPPPSSKRGPVSQSIRLSLWRTRCRSLIGRIFYRHSATVG